MNVENLPWTFNFSVAPKNIVAFSIASKYKDGTENPETGLTGVQCSVWDIDESITGTPIVSATLGNGITRTGNVFAIKIPGSNTLTIGKYKFRTIFFYNGTPASPGVPATLGEQRDKTAGILEVTESPRENCTDFNIYESTPIAFGTSVGAAYLNGVTNPVLEQAKFAHILINCEGTVSLANMKVEEQYFAIKRQGGMALQLSDPYDGSNTSIADNTTVHLIYTNNAFYKL